MHKAYIFDWDGTLADTPRLTHSIYRQVFAGKPGKRLAFQDFKRLFGREHSALYDFMKLSPRERADADAKWLEIYRTRQHELEPYPGAMELLLKLRKSGVKLGLVSSGKNWRVNEELELLGMGRLFDAVVTVEQIARPKPEADGLLAVAKKLGVQPKQCVYVGDMTEDVIAGRNARMKTAVVTHGMHEEQDLLKLKPDFVLKRSEGRPLDFHGIK